MANLNYLSAADYIYLYIENMDASYSYDDRSCSITISLNGTVVGRATADIPPLTSSYYLTTFNGLNPDTTYSISCTVSYGGGSQTFYLTAKTTEREKYDAYVYVTEEGIAAVSAYSYCDGVSYYCDDTETAISDQTDALVFTAILETGYEFDHWEYRIGSATATKYTNTSNPYSYNSLSEFHIKPFAKKTRPENWSWWYMISSDSDVNLYADEWTDFCSRINAFRVYKQLSEYSFSSVGVDDYISAAICNQAWTAINAISGHGTMPSAAVSDGDMYASFFTGLRDALNAIE